MASNNEGGEARIVPAEPHGGAAAPGADGTARAARVITPAQVITLTRAGS
ncbi:MAG: hypothetical protein FWG56_06925 [Desulfovibrionaceae bacterium]|nr:hypothetical protein [Desulfovibrionaceae bacterium]